MQSVRRLEPDGGIMEVPASAVEEETLEGGIFVVPQCLARFGHFQALVELSQSVIEEVVGKEQSDAVRERGFELVHEILSSSEVMIVADTIQRRLERVIPGIAHDLVKHVLGHTGDFHYEQHPNVRFHVPFDLWQRDKKKYQAYAKDHGEGKLSPHDPHRDQWYRCPENAINVWIAIGRVERGNGMSLYPDVYRREVLRTAKGSIEHHQQLGRRVNFSLEPDDALIFHGAHLHSSELNRTSHTRYVVSFRLTLSAPRVSTLSNHRYFWSRYDRGPMGRALGLGEKVLRNVGTLLPRPKTALEAALPAIPDLSVRADGNTLKFSAADVPPDTLVPLPKRLCAARVDGKVVVFLRTCPHAAADLAMGTLRGAELTCPEHNVPFDLRTGQSPCRSLATLKQRPCVERDGELEVSLGD
jgi:nitrite reductase/ring-hydroxylating ferredoxin subunit